jgi:hypothetical protein
MRRLSRKIVPVFVSSLLTFALIPMTASSSQAVTVDGFKYSIAGKTATVIGCSGTCPESISIPSVVPQTNIAVTSIGERAFASFPQPYIFTAVTLPASITSIQEQAFREVTISSSLLLPAKLTRIEDGAFQDSTLSSITFNDALTYIGDQAFSGANISADSTLVMQTGEIGTAAFQNVSFRKVALGSDFSSVGSSAFAKSFGSTTTPKINELSIGGGDIKYSAFQETETDKVTLGNKIGIIYSDAFAGTNSGNGTFRGELTVNSGVIGEGAFGYSRFTSVNIGKLVLSVGSGAFGANSQPYPSLGSVTVDARVINQGAFSGASMASLTLGTNVAFIGSGSFGGNSGPFGLGVVAINGGTFSQNAFTEVKADKTTIAATVNKVGESAFDSSDLGSLSINSAQIDRYAFYHSNARSLTIGSNVKSIGESAFQGFQISDGGDKAITLNPEVIGSNSFYQSNFTSITLGSKVRLIGNSAFAELSDLERVVVNSGQINSYSFRGSGIKTLVIGSGVTRIGQAAFLDTNLDTLDIANGVTNIEDSAFSGIGGNLTEVRIPNSVVTIGEGAFNSAGLMSVFLGSGVRYLEDYPFSQNPELTDISFYGAPPVGNSAFSNQPINLHHTASNLSAWTSKFTANPDWSNMVTRVSGLPQPTFTYTSTSSDKPTASKITVKANYTMSATGTVEIKVTQSGSKTILCSAKVQTRLLSGVAKCDLSKKVRDGLKKKALTLNVALTYSPDLGDNKTLNKSLVLKKQ